MSTEISMTPQAVQAKTKNLVARNTLKELSKLSNSRSGARVFFEFASIALMITASEYFGNPFLYAFAAIWIGARIHGMGVLAHDAAHYLLFSNKKWNDIIGHILGFFIFQNFLDYRRMHFAHHRFLGDDGDLEKCGWDGLPESRKERFGMLFIAASGVKIFFIPLIVGQFLLRSLKSGAGIDRIKIAAFVLGVTGLIVVPYAAKLLLFYWIIPAVTWLSACSQIRNIAEHCFLDTGHPYKQSWTVYSSLLSKIFVCPNNVNYHQAHHLYPSVPWFNLQKLNNELLKDREYRDSHASIGGYFSFLKAMLLNETRAIYQFRNHTQSDVVLKE